MNEKRIAVILIVIIFTSIVIAGFIFYKARYASLSYAPQGVGGDNSFIPQPGEWAQTESGTDDFFYSVEYPSDWLSRGTDTESFFFPQGSEGKDEESIMLNFINYQKTPPPPVAYQYTTIRTLTSAKGIPIFVQERTPGTPREYMATLGANEKGYTAELRFGSTLDHKYDSVFDHIATSFEFQ